MAGDKSLEVSEAAGRATVVFERSMERIGDAAWRRMRHRPYLGVAVTSGAALLLASLVGVGELAFACLAGYAAFKMLRQHEPPSQALPEVTQLEKNLGL